MLIQTVELILAYVGVFIGAIVQALFLLLPVDFKNWEDDSTYVLTYVAIQGLSGAFIFILVPYLLEIRGLQTNTLVGVIIGICILAALRALKIIPLEFTFPIKAPVITEKRLLFTDFYEAQRYLSLGEFSFELPDGEYRYNEFRERLKRTRAEDNESILEELISLENDSPN
ncbi:hypothetical protein [Silvanigrella aquatica]|uniref:Uncharacterized protein n=1 Tax=Silvanigrella aquatica TaxID=1915309 RepID=A0A1L4CYK9_9BACT|nr:hypothetical protein [Silvanigrella aquatica]APJ03020.1 hypothetical protein AXG55_03455 [Silvanigrella aquatica]